MEPESKKSKIDKDDQIRAQVYVLLSELLLNPPTTEMLARMSNIKMDSDTPICTAISKVSKLASSTKEEAAKNEYFALFIGIGRGELLPYASYYLTGFLNEKPLAKLRNSMRELGLSVDENNKIPEDHLGILFEMMTGFILGAYGKQLSIKSQKDFFFDHIEPWAGVFFGDLEKAKNSKLYQPVGTVGRLFVEIESQLLTMNN